MVVSWFVGQDPPVSVCSHLREQGSAACLDGLNLGGCQRGAVEARRKLVAVKVDALGSGNGAEVGTGLAANASVGSCDGLAKRAKLLRMIAIRAESGVRRLERLGEGVGRRFRMGLRCVVDRDCQGQNCQLRASHRGKSGGYTPGMVLFPRNLMDGVRSAC